MLERVRLADSWRAIESELAPGWVDARLRLHISDPTRFDRAARALGPFAPGRVGGASLVLTLARASAASNLRKHLERLDAEGIAGRLELVGSDAPAVTARDRATLVSDWDRELAALPDDWSDLYVEVELESSDQLARAALLLAPCNPSRVPVKSLHFRCARMAGYGVSGAMARRCLERLDGDGIRGAVHVLRVLSETDLVHTQGPVWYVGGKSV
jgi:hypothetical protein